MYFFYKDSNWLECQCYDEDSSNFYYWFLKEEKFFNVISKLPDNPVPGFIIFDHFYDIFYVFLQVNKNIILNLT